MTIHCTGVNAVARSGDTDNGSEVDVLISPSRVIERADFRTPCLRSNHHGRGAEGFKKESEMGKHTERLGKDTRAMTCVLQPHIFNFA